MTDVNSPNQVDQLVAEQTFCLNKSFVFWSFRGQNWSERIKKEGEANETFILDVELAERLRNCSCAHHDALWLFIAEHSTGTRAIGYTDLGTRFQKCL